MQRRAAAVSAVVFLLLAAGAYAFIGVAEEPTVTVEGEYRLSAGDTFTGPDGTTYNVSSVSGSRATFSWYVASSTYTKTWANNTTVDYDGEKWRLLVANGSDPAQFTLREQLNVSAILANDTAVKDQTVTIGGERHVVYAANDTVRPLSAYLREPATRTFDEGQTILYRGNETTIANVSSSSVRLEWPAPRTPTASVAAGERIELGGTTYLAHFPADASKVVLTTNFEAYNAEVEQVDYFHERIEGLWAVSILSGLVAIFLLGLAYMPSRY